MAGAGVEHRRVAEQRGEPAAQVGVEARWRRVHDSSRDRAAVRAAAALTSATTARTCSAVGARGRRARPSPATAIALTPFGLDRAPCRTVASAPCALGRGRARRARRRRRPASGRGGRPAGWCRRGWPRPAGRTASGRAARSRSPTPTGRSEVDQAAALLDVQLDEARRCGAASRRRGRAGRGSRPGRCHRLGQRRRRRRRSGPARSVGVSAPVSSREPAQATPNRAPSSSAKLTTPIGRAGSNPRVAQQRRARRRRDTTPSGPSNAPPSGTESRCDPTTTPGPSRRGRPTRPTGCRCGRVVSVQPARGRLAGEPLAQRRVLAASRRSGGSRRCAAVRRPSRPASSRQPTRTSSASRVEWPRHRPLDASLGSRIGIRTPRSAATSSAPS